MAWYRTGTVTVANGSATVTGVGSAWASPAVRVGYAFMGPDGALYEIGAINTSTEITLTTPYGGANGSGQTYGIIPTQSLNVELHAAMLQLVQTANEKIDPLDAWKVAQEQAQDTRIAAKEAEVATFLNDADRRWPLIRLSPNQRGNCPSVNTWSGWSINAGATVQVELLRTIPNGVDFASRPADDQALLSAMGNALKYQAPSTFNVLKMTWTNAVNGDWSAFPGSMPISQDSTAAAVTKLISGNIEGDWMEGVGPDWAITGVNITGNANAYRQSHPKLKTTAGEVHFALPAFCMGRREISTMTDWGWLPSMFGTGADDYDA